MVGSYQILDKRIEALAVEIVSMAECDVDVNLRLSESISAEMDGTITITDLRSALGSKIDYLDTIHLEFPGVEACDVLQLSVDLLNNFYNSNF